MCYSIFDSPFFPPYHSHSLIPPLSEWLSKQRSSRIHPIPEVQTRPRRLRLYDGRRRPVLGVQIRMLDQSETIILRLLSLLTTNAVDWSMSTDKLTILGHDYTIVIAQSHSLSQLERSHKRGLFACLGEHTLGIMEGLSSGGELALSFRLIFMSLHLTCPLAS